MNKDILIFGKGFIGQKLGVELDCSITEKMISTFSDAHEEVEKNNPKVIINCIGYTGKNNVDDCEKEKNQTLLANTFIPIILAEIAFRKKIKLVHVSSGCVYHFNYQNPTPITEKIVPDFFDLFYSRTKIYAEMALMQLINKANILIVRPRIPLDNKPASKNLLTKLLSFENIIDIPNSVAYLPDFFKMIKHLINIDAKGIYNTVSKGALRYSELLDIYKKYVPDYKYKIINDRDFTKTRTNLILSVKKLESTGYKVRDIHEVLEECVKTYTSY